MEYSDKYDVVMNILARVLKASSKASIIKGGLKGPRDEEQLKSILSEALTYEDIMRAKQVALKLMQPAVDQIILNPPVSKSKRSNKRKFPVKTEKIFNMQSLTPYKHPLAKNAQLFGKCQKISN